MIYPRQLAFLLVLTGCCAAHAQVVAFPGAEGAGKDAVGGRGGDVYHVTNLNNSGAGSLRYGIDNAIGPTTVVFDVGGTIDLNSRINIDSPYITVAGQTAPGGGITLKGYHLQIADTHDVIVRYVRVRPGDIHTAPNPGGYEPDSLAIDNSEDVVIDHVSVSWSTDENLSPTHDSNNVTVQWSMITEALHNSNHSKGNHGYGTLLNGGDYTFHHNLYAHNRSRNPRPQEGGPNPTILDFVNNVIYNPGDKFGYSTTDNNLDLNFVNNYGIAGPNTTYSDLYNAQSTGTLIYQSGNYMDLNENGMLDGSNGGWSDFSGTYTQIGSRFDLPMVTTESAADALVSVLGGVGASLWRDAVDTRIINDVLSYGLTGDHIDSQDEVGGWPVIPGGAALLDTDQDGMPDEYEDWIGLNKNNAADRNGDDNTNGYTDLEDYLAFLAAGMSIPSMVPGDADGDGDVDLDDYNIMSGNMYTNVAGGADDGDFDDDGDVDFEDFVIQALNFGDWPNEQVGQLPEPGIGVILILGVAAGGVLRCGRGEPV